MNCSSTAFPLALLTLILCSQCARSADPIADRLEKAKSTHEKEMKKLEAEALKFFEAEEKKWRVASNEKKVDETLDAKKAFDETGALPASAPALLKQNIAREMKAIVKAYDDAIKAYTLMKKEDLAAAAERELKTIQEKIALADSKSIPADAKVAPGAAFDLKAERKIAEILRQHAHLQLTLTNGSIRAAGKAEPLPQAAFAITQISLNDDELPSNFSEEIFLPALAQLRFVRRISSGLATVIFSDEQIAAFVKLPVAKKLETLSVRLELTQKSVDALKQLPNLTDLTCWATTADNDLLNRMAEPPRLKLTQLRLNNLGVSGTVTKKGLDKLMAMPLKSLSILGSAELKGDLFQNLSKMPNLERLTAMTPAAWSDDDFKDLARCPRLSSLEIVGADHVTDEALAHLAKSATLTSLTISAAKISDAALKHVARIRNLKILGFQCPDAADAGLVHLKSCAALNDLRLYGTKVSDQGIDHIAKIRTLKTVHLTQTNVTENGIRKLTKIRPDLTVFFGEDVIQPKLK